MLCNKCHNILFSVGRNGVPPSGYRNPVPVDRFNVTIKFCYKECPFVQDHLLGEVLFYFREITLIYSYVQIAGIGCSEICFFSNGVF